MGYKKLSLEQTFTVLMGQIKKTKMMKIWAKKILKRTKAISIIIKVKMVTAYQKYKNKVKVKIVMKIFKFQINQKRIFFLYKKKEYSLINYKIQRNNYNN